LFTFTSLLSKVDLTYEYAHVGDDAKSLEALAAGRDKFATKLLKAKHPIIVLGTGCLQRKDGQQILDFVRTMCAKLRAAGSVDPGWQILSVMHRIASQVRYPSPFFFFDQ
jgi:hypothetical protein